MTLDIIRALHIIFIVTWFAGLFYMFRLFVYHAEAGRKTEPARSILIDQYKIMERRLWYFITWPSCILTLIAGPWLLIKLPEYLNQPWMYMKLFLVVLLIIYQLYGQKIFTQLKDNPRGYSSIKLRLLNEVATVLLVAIVFLVVLKDSVSWLWGTLGIFGMAGIFTLIVYQYRRKRRPSEPE
ncbi:MAG: CopD family protein [Flavobacteriales bacterium]|nr:CopD family protein [Flavobacteriales bacterium]